MFRQVDAIAACVLGLIQAFIHNFQDLSHCSVAPLSPDNPQRDGDIQQLAFIFQFQTFAGGAQILSHALRILRLGFWQQDHEFLAAATAARIFLADVHLDQLNQLIQD